MATPTIYRDLGILTCGGEIHYDNTDYGFSDIPFTPSYTQFWYMFLEHGEAVTFTFNFRIHQPTVGFNNNTEAIYFATFFGLGTNGTPSGDHGDFNGSYTTTYYNSSPNNIQSAANGSQYEPGRWIRFEQFNVDGSMEFHYSASACVKLPVGPGHTTIPGPIPSTQTNPGDGGWNVGQA